MKRGRGCTKIERRKGSEDTIVKIDGQQRKGVCKEGKRKGIVKS